MKTSFDGTGFVARSIALWGLAGAVFRHWQAVRSWETPRGQREHARASAIPGWADALREMQREENDALLAACFAAGMA